MNFSQHSTTTLALVIILTAALLATIAVLKLSAWLMARTRITWGRTIFYAFVTQALSVLGDLLTPAQAGLEILLARLAVFLTLIILLGGWLFKDHARTRDNVALGWRRALLLAGLAQGIMLVVVLGFAGINHLVPKPAQPASPTAVSDTPSLFIDQNGNIINGKIEGSLAATHDIGCIALTEVKPAYTPPDLYKGTAACIAKDDYARAARLFALGGLYARFDVERITDQTASQGRTVLLRNIFGTLPEDRKAKLTTAFSELNKPGDALNSLCRDIRAIGPPDYYPAYLVLHGMKAYVGNPHDEALKKDFDAKAAWSKLLTGHIHCQAPAS